MTCTAITVRPSRSARSYSAKSGIWSIVRYWTARMTRVRRECRAPSPPIVAAESSPLRTVTSSLATPERVTASTARLASAGSSTTTSRWLVGYAIDRRATASRPSAALDEWLDLADESLERLDVVRRRLLGDHRPEAELHVRRQPLGDLLDRSGPEHLALHVDLGQRQLVALELPFPDPLRLGMRVPNGDLDAECELDVGDVAPHRVTVAAQDVDLVGEHLGRARRVPQVGRSRDRPQRLLLAGAADHDRNVALDGRRMVDRLLEGVVAARLGRHHLAVEECSDRARRLVQPVESLPDARAEVDAVGLVLVVEPGTAEPGDRAPVRDVVDRRDHLRHEPGVPERVRADHQPEPGPLRRHGPRGKRRVALEDRLVRGAEDRVDVVPGPQVLVAQRVDALRAVEELRPRTSLAPEQDSELQVGHAGSSWATGSGVGGMARGRRSCPAHRSAGPTRTPRGGQAIVARSASRSSRSSASRIASAASRAADRCSAAWPSSPAVRYARASASWANARSQSPMPCSSQISRHRRACQMAGSPRPSTA